MAVALAAAGVLSLATAAASPAKDYGRWRMTLTGEVHEQWRAPDTGSCAVTGSGTGDVRFATAQPIAIRLRRIPLSARFPAHWDAGADPFRFSVSTSASTAASAVRQPSADPDNPCSGPDPQTWTCGSLAYSARAQVKPGVRILRRNRFGFPTAFGPPGFLVTSLEPGGLAPSEHRPDGSAGCFEADSIDFGLAPFTPGKELLFQLPSPARVAHLRRIAVPADTTATRTINVDEGAAVYHVNLTYQRRALLVLTRVR